MPPGNDDTPLPTESTPVLDTWAGHMNRMAQQNGRWAQQTFGNRDCDCTRQLVGAVCCGIFCLPCSCTRLIGSCTGCIQPTKTPDGKEGFKIPGLEYCSSNNCCDGDRGYEYVGYTEGQQGGSGFSRRTLDIINVIVTPIIWGIVAITSFHQD